MGVVLSQFSTLVKVGDTAQSCGQNDAINTGDKDRLVLET